MEFERFHQRDCLHRRHYRYCLTKELSSSFLDQAKTSGFEVYKLDASALLPHSKVIFKLSLPGNSLHVSGGIGLREVEVSVSRGNPQALAKWEELLAVV